MEIVNSDLKKYLQRNVFPTRTVLVFPPFNGFRRFLIHKLIEDNYSSSEVAAFSIGQDIGRRIVVCYKGLIRDNQQKEVQNIFPKTSGIMIEKEKQNKQKLTPTAAVYRPPAARIAESRQNIDENVRTSESKRIRVRRPDQQMYVPRPKRASLGNEQPRSRSRSSSRTSLESCPCDNRMKTPPQKNKETRLSGFIETKTKILSDSDKTELPDKLSLSLETCSTDKIISSCTSNSDVLVEDKPEVGYSSVQSTPSENPILNDLKQVNPLVSSDKLSEKDLPLIVHREIQEPSEFSQRVHQCVSSIGEYMETRSDSEEIRVNDTSKIEKRTEIENIVTEIEGDSSINKDDITQENKTINTEKTELMEVISLSSDSKDENSSSVSTSGSDSRNIDSSDTEMIRKHSRRKSNEDMEIDHSRISETKNDFNSERNTLHDQNHKTRRIFPNMPVSDVLIITDSSSSNDTTYIPKDAEPTIDSKKGKMERLPATKEYKKSQINPAEYDWESLYDDSGECLFPNLMEELTNSVGRVRVASVDSDYRPYQTIEERTNDGECVIEIYDFPAEFKTTDLFNVFAAYRSKNFQIKWVDDTHALGVFPSPLMADEVLACTLPYVKTRPLRLGIAESQNKARNLVLPPLPSIERPKTCTALARRLVSGALGLRLPTSSQERERERQMLKEAREKRRQEAKQRDAAWDGTITNENGV